MAYSKVAYINGGRDRHDRPAFRFFHPQHKSTAVLLGLTRTTLVIIVGLLGAACAQPFFLSALLDGSSGQPLSISPETASLLPGETITFTATGGVEPYDFTVVSGDGTIDPESGRYTAAQYPGGATVSVSDAHNKVKTADVTVRDGATPTEIDYGNVVVANTGGTNGGGALSGEFSFQNVGTQSGTAEVAWYAYVSQNSFLGGDAVQIANGTVSAPGAGSSTTASFSGTWPPYAGTYYLIVFIASAEDGNTTNNTGVSSPIEITGSPAPDIDYRVTYVTNIGNPTTKSSPISETFEIRNDGTVDGASPVYWYAYVSNDTEYTAGDTLIDAGSHPALPAAFASGPITIGGTWPNTAGEFYIVVRIESVDDSVPANNTLASGAFDVFDASTIEYRVPNVTRNDSRVVTNSPIIESFDVRNTGDTDGTEPIEWEAYLSVNTVYQGGDELVANGTIAALAAGQTAAGLTISGTWSIKGDFYLIVRVTAADQTTSGWRYGVAGPFTVADPPNYSITSVALPAEKYGGRVGAPLMGQTPAGTVAHRFSIRNSEFAGLGVQNVSWAAYFSVDGTIDAGDEILASGVIAPIPPGETAGPFEFGGDFGFPSEPGAYHIIIRITAGDDSTPGDNTHVSAPVRVWTSPNFETDTGGENDTIPTAEDFSVVLNPGDMVTVSGVKDASGGKDIFKFYTGPEITAMRVRATWTDGSNQIDLYVYDATTAEDGSSTNNSHGVEPATGYLSPLSPLATESWYYVEVRFGGSSVLGSGYTLSVEAD